MTRHKAFIVKHFATATFALLSMLYNDVNHINARGLKSFFEKNNYEVGRVAGPSSP